MTKYLNKTELDKAITSIATRGKKLDADIQHASLSALKLLADYAGVEWINKLYKALPNGARKSALTTWFLAFGGVVANENKETKADTPFVYSKDKSTDLEAVEKTPWYDIKKQPEPDQVFDIQAALIALIAPDCARHEGREEGRETAQGLV
jgi:hypothetical protein